MATYMHCFVSSMAFVYTFVIILPVVSMVPNAYFTSHADNCHGELVCFVIIWLLYTYV